MGQPTTKRNVFRTPAPSGRGGRKAEEGSARAIIEAEARKRDDKTARLKKARLEQQANEPPPEPVAAKPKRAKAKPAG